mmetsp:Transcript_22004/g.61546  ORF Transcript_22004/g.61546 Transcript_22004/m.61546 type:complete len:102 (-) Transcript_22004:3-308(-)
MRLQIFVEFSSPELSLRVETGCEERPTASTASEASASMLLQISLSFDSDLFSADFLGFPPPLASLHAETVESERLRPPRLAGWIRGEVLGESVGEVDADAT